MGAGQRKLLLVLGTVPITLLDVKFWNRRWTAQAIIGVGNGTNNTFGCKFQRWALDIVSYKL